jgi:pteridine reductase
MPSLPVALITGSAKRVGAAIAKTLHAAGFDLALHYRHSQAEAAALAEQLERERPGSIHLLQADLNDSASLAPLVHAAQARFQRLDALINNASSFYPTPLGEISAAQIDDLYASNAKAPLLLAQAAAPFLRERGGSIVNLTDIYGERPLPRYAPYCMAKAALIACTYALARELGPKVRVNAISPGNIMWSENMEKAETPQVVLDRTALQRQGEPDDIARTVKFLLQDAPYITGQILRVDGGRILYI